MEWTLEKIKSYISNGIEENLHLDYKRLASLQKNDSNKKELTKDVSAFANSDGGVIIYGVIEEQHKPTALDTDSSSEITKEWIENVIHSTISPKVDQIHIYPIDNPENGNQLFVITIPKSERAPHMASDNRYYKRYNFKSAPMEHYEIEDIRNRSTTPNLIIKPTSFINDCSSGKAMSGIFNMTIQNEANVLVKYYSIFLGVPQSWQFNLDPANVFNDTGEDIINGTRYKIISRNCLPPDAMPLWKGKTFKILSHPPKIEIPLANANELLIAQLSCPSAPDKAFHFYPNLSDNTVNWIHQIIGDRNSGDTL